MNTTLEVLPALSRTDLMAPSVAAALGRWPEEDAARVEIAGIDPALSDTVEFCEAYGVALADSANCVVVAAKRGGATAYAACVVPATGRADVNGLVRRHLGARKVSFAPMDAVLADTGMEYGGITPVGLPEDWPVLVDAEVAAHPGLVVGSGIRGSKLWVPGPLLAGLPGARVLQGLGVAVA